MLSLWITYRRGYFNVPPGFRAVYISVVEHYAERLAERRYRRSR